MDICIAAQGVDDQPAVQRLTTPKTQGWLLCLWGKQQFILLPYMESIDGAISGKTIALFGSYGWGDGQWMREWAERVTGEGATVVNGEGLICQETPDDAMIEECKNLGKALAANA